MSRQIGTWLLPLFVHSNYASPAAFEIHHQLTTGDLSVDLLMLRTASGGEVFIDAADNASNACYKVFVWRGLQVGFDSWPTGESSRRRPAKAGGILENSRYVAANLPDLQDEIAHRIVELAQFVSAATLVPTRVVVQANRGRIVSIGSD